VINFADDVPVRVSRMCDSWSPTSANSSALMMNVMIC